jgi:uncharacterized membrane protein YjjP (DUF1212 family)
MPGAKWSYMLYFFLCLDFGLSLFGSFFFAVLSGGKALDLIIAAILGVSATVALAGASVVHAVDQLPRPAKVNPNIV